MVIMQVFEIVKADKPKVMDEKKYNARKEKFIKKNFIGVKMEGYKKNIEGQTSLKSPKIWH